MRVMKFGGASLRDGPAIERSARLVERETEKSRILLVVSAQEGVTAQLARAADQAVRGDLEPWDALRVRHRSVLAQLGLAGDLLDRHLFELRGILEELQRSAHADRRMRDYVLSFGERMSARVVAATLRRLGLGAAPLDAYDLGLTTASRQGEEALLAAPTPALRAQLEAVPGIPVVTGFLALDPAGNLTTLGPNGSDLTAVWFGEAVGAEEVVLWKAVAGFLSADPELVPEARLIPVLGRDEAVEFAVHGAEVLHAGALEPAARGAIAVRVADVGDPDAPGSRIEAATPGIGPLGLAHRASLALYRETLALGRDQGARLAELFGELAAAALEPYRAACSGRSVVALVADEERAAAFAARRAPRAELVRGLASFAVVGRELASVAGLEARVLELAGRAGVRIERAPGDTSPSSLVFLVAASELEQVVRRVHAGLFGASAAAGSHVLLPHPGGEVRSQGNFLMIPPER
jgi:aspartate kinase